MSIKLAPQRPRALGSTLVAVPRHPIASRFATRAGVIDREWEMLRNYTKQDGRGLAEPMRDSAAKRLALKSALLLVASQPYAEVGWHPDTPQVILGILSSDVRMGVRALRDWASALKVPFILPTSRVAGCESVAQVTGTVFIKYNAASQLCYVSEYSGSDRGVLVTLGSELLGHFPLGIFDEAMENAAPKM